MRSAPRLIQATLCVAPLLFALVLPGAALARDLPSSKPERVGMSSDRLARIDALAERYVSDGRVPGIVTMVARKGQIVHFKAHGARGFDDDRPLAKDDLFRIYSMTKPITAVAIMQLYEQGAFQLSDPISKFVPELTELEVLQDDGTRVPAASPITMQQLLTHTAGFSYGFDPTDPVDQLYRETRGFDLEDLDAFVAALAKLPLKYQPGSRWHYSVAVDVTGLIVERISGERFDRYLAKHIFEPLAMNDTFFSVPDNKMNRFLPNHAFNPKAGKAITLGEDSINRFRNATLFSGGGGLVSTAEDYMRFAEMLRAGGRGNGAQILSPTTVQFMTMDHLPASTAAYGSGEAPTLGASTMRGFGFGLGFGVVTDVADSGLVGSVGDYQWGGAAGTIFWVDPVEDVVALAMIQLMNSPWPLRADFKVAVNQAIIESNR
ncbi:MAG: serine hydrolase domain-containing protein [Pseudomonadota bacterium]